MNSKVLLTFLVVSVSLVSIGGFSLIKIEFPIQLNTSLPKESIPAAAPNTESDLLPQDSDPTAAPNAASSQRQPQESPSATPNMLTYQRPLEATANSCPSGPPTQLRANVRAIQMKPGHIVLLREPKIGLSDNVIGKIQKCEFVTILDGSTCGDKYNHFRVRTDDAKEGWAAEANNDRQKYWLVPVLDHKKCNLPPIFVPGETATSDHPSSGFIRKEPVLDAATLSWTIVKGDTVKIINGPICNDTYIWYKVHGEKHPDPGWTEVGRGNDYFFDIPDRIKVTNDPDAEATC